MSGDGFATRFLKGRRSAYGKKFWRWIVSLNDAQSQDEFATKTLGFSVGTGGTTISKGLNHGQIDLNQIIHVLLRLGKSIREHLPELPRRPVLVLHGMLFAISEQGECCPTVEALACLFEIDRHRSKFIGTKAALEGSKALATHEKWKTRATGLAKEISTSVNRVLSLYSAELPGELTEELTRGICQRQRDFTFLTMLWTEWSARFENWQLFVEGHDWSYSNEQASD